MSPGTDTMAAVTLVLVTEAGAGADRAGWRKPGRDGRDILDFSSLLVTYCVGEWV